MVYYGGNIGTMYKIPLFIKNQMLHLLISQNLTIKVYYESIILNIDYVQ